MIDKRDASPLTAVATNASQRSDRASSGGHSTRPEANIADPGRRGALFGWSKSPETYSWRWTSPLTNGITQFSLVIDHRWTTSTRESHALLWRLVRQRRPTLFP